MLRVETPAPFLPVSPTQMMLVPVDRQGLYLHPAAACRPGLPRGKSDRRWGFAIGRDPASCLVAPFGLCWRSAKDPGVGEGLSSAGRPCSLV